MQAREAELYARFAGYYDKLFSWLFVPRHRQAIRRLELAPGALVADVGCGTGLSLTEYRADVHVVGIELSARMLEVAHDRALPAAQANVDLVRADACKTPFPDGAFDAVVCAFVISVVDDPPALSRELARITRVGGEILILNHFRARNRLCGRFEDWIEPLCLHLGWRSNLTIEEALGDAPLDVTDVASYRRLDLWKTICCRRRCG